MLGDEPEIFKSVLTAGNLNFIEIPFLKEPIEIQAKIRYSTQPAAAVLSPLTEDTVKVVFEQPQRAITPGQSVVFYNGDSVIGGGTILSDY